MAQMQWQHDKGHLSKTRMLRHISLTSCNIQPVKTWACHKFCWPASSADLVGRPGLFLEDGKKTNFNYSHLGIQEEWGGGGAREGSKV